MNGKQNVKFFIIACEGRSSSVWLAEQVHLAPFVTCCHNVTSIAYELLGYGSHPLMHSLSYMLQMNYRQNEMKLFLSLLQKIHPAPIVGSVHTYRMRDIDNIVSENTPPFCLYHLFRHPVTMLDSAYASEKHLCEIDSTILADRVNNVSVELAEEWEDIRSIINAAHIHDDLDVCLFITAIGKMKFINIRPDKVPISGIIKMEEITSSIDAFHDVLEMIGVSDEVIGKHYADIAFRPQNAHRKKPKTVESTWDSWEPWQRELMHYFYHKHGDYAREADYELPV